MTVGQEAVSNYTAFTQFGVLEMKADLTPLIRFIEHLPKNGDLELSLLKCHLLVEEVLTKVRRATPMLSRLRQSSLRPWCPFERCEGARNQATRSC